jgi:hypothetical protein
LDCIKSLIQRETSVKLNKRSVKAKEKYINQELLISMYLPRAINVQLLKFLDRGLFDNRIIVRKFPPIPITDTIKI